MSLPFILLISSSVSLSCICSSETYSYNSLSCSICFSIISFVLRLSIVISSILFNRFVISTGEELSLSTSGDEVLDRAKNEVKGEEEDATTSTGDSASFWNKIKMAQSSSNAVLNLSITLSSKIDAIPSMLRNMLRNKIPGPLGRLPLRGKGKLWPRAPKRTWITKSTTTRHVPLESSKYFLPATESLFLTGHGRLRPCENLFIGELILTPDKSS